jgi:hypothetical protein
VADRPPGPVAHGVIPSQEAASLICRAHILRCSLGAGHLSRGADDEHHSRALSPALLALDESLDPFSPIYKALVSQVGHQQA